MRNLNDLPLVSCQLEFSDGLADIASFRAGAARANWTNTEITVAVATACNESYRFDEVGEVLYQYCTDASWA